MDDKITLDGQPLTKSLNDFPVIGVGASAGGLEAFTKLLGAIPKDSGMAYVLVQHLHPGHESMLPEILQKVTTIKVLQIENDIKILPNHIYIIPSNKLLVATDGKLVLTKRPENKNERNLPIDIFFSSLAEVHQSHSIGVVLSGTASDGTLGLKAIKEQGGITFAQDTLTAAFDGMPHNAVQAGVVDFILPPDKIPSKIHELTKIIYSDLNDETSQQKQDIDVYRQILGLLRMRKGTDFTYYKQSTLKRRIFRRMAINQQQEPSAYVKFLLSNKSEQDALYQDFLIPVTSFFRDPASFDNICETVIPRIFKNKSDGEAVRIWVAGCSTGEEAYSLAICIQDHIKNRLQQQYSENNNEKKLSDTRVQIFASDLSEQAIVKARSGIYHVGDIDGLSSKHLNEYFTKSNGEYLVKKEIRDMCVFAVHNFLREPPFGKMDLISCRNVLIYVEPYLQKKALTTFHYALKPEGTLWLGKSETITNVPDLFANTSMPEKIFVRKDAPAKFMHTTTHTAERKLQHGNVSLNFESRTDFQRVADDIMLSQYTPAGVVVNEVMDIVHFRGNTSNYLEQSPGKPSHNLLKMAKHGLAFELRNILHKAKKDKVSVLKDNLPVEVYGMIRKVSIEAIPLTNIAEPHYLVLFHDTLNGGIQPLNISSQGETTESDKDLRIKLLVQELAQNREDMRGITEDQEATNEEMQSANEELLSSSEELQSLNEELETSKEELQSTNEELIVVNQELISMNELITVARDYAQNIITSIREPFLVLDKSLRVRTANSAFYKTFQVSEKETEGTLIYNLGEGQWNIPELRTLLEDVLPKNSTFSDYELKIPFPNIGERIMLLNAREIRPNDSDERLLLLTIADITDQKIAKKKLAENERQFNFIAESIPQKIWTADAEGNRNYFNKQWSDYTGLSLEDLKNGGWKKIIHQDDLVATINSWNQSIATGNDFEVENRKRNKKGEYKWHLSRAIALNDEKGAISMWIGTSTEMEKQKKHSVDLEKAITERTYELETANILLQRKNIQLQNMNKELESFTYVSSHDLQEPLRKIQTFATRILDKENLNLSASGKNMFLRIQESGQRMQALIQDLLSFSRLSTSDRKYEMTDLKELIGQVIEDIKETIEEKKATIEVDMQLKVKIIPFQFRQLMHNLISNALKFSHASVTPLIIIHGKIVKGSELDHLNILQKANHYHISVADNGIGFEPNFNEKIFEVFQKLHDKDVYSGTGIGLAIVKKIVENHNGIITAESELGKGAKFDIYIPENS